MSLAFLDSEYFQKLQAQATANIEAERQRQADLANSNIKLTTGYISSDQIRSESDALMWIKQETYKSQFAAEQKLEADKQAALTDLTTAYYAKEKNFNDLLTQGLTMGAARSTYNSGVNVRDPLTGVYQTGPRLPEKKEINWPLFLGVAAIAFYFLKRRK